MSQFGGCPCYTSQVSRSWTNGRRTSVENGGRDSLWTNGQLTPYPSANPISVLSLHTRRGLGGDSPEDINGFAVLRVSVAQHNLQVVVKNENTVGTTGTAEHVIKFIVTDMTAQVECSRSRLFPLIGVESRCHLSDG